MQPKAISWDHLFLRRSFSVAIGILICIVVTYNLHFPSPFMAVIPVTVIPLVFPQAVLSFGVMRVTGCLLGFLVGALHLGVVYDQALSILLCFVVNCVAGYLVAIRYQLYAALMGGITYNVMFFYAYLNYEKGLEFGLHWSMAVVIGTLILNVCYITLWPKSLLQDVLTNIHCLQDRVLSFLKDPKKSTSYSLHEVLSIENFLAVSVRGSEEASTQLSFLKRIRFPLKHLAKQAENIPDTFLREKKLPLYEVIEEAKQNIEKFFKSGEITTDFPLLHAYEKLLQKEREREALIKSLDYNAIESIVSIPFHLKKIYHGMQKSAEEGDSEKKAPQTTSLFTKKNILLAVRFSLAICLTDLVVILLKLPVGVQPIITSLIILVQPNDGKAVRQATYRFLGIFLGLVVGIGMIFATLIITQFAAFCLLFTSAMFFFAFLGMRVEKYSYVFLQASLIFILLFTFSSSGYVDAHIVLERLLGALIGFAIPSIVIFLWPVKDPWSVLIHFTSSSLRKLAQGFEGVVKAHYPIRVEFMSNIKELDEIKEDLKFFRSKSGYKFDSIDEFYDRVYAIVTEGWYLTTLRIPGEITKIYAEEMRELTEFLHYAANEVEKGKEVEFTRKVDAFHQALIYRKALVRQKGLTFKLSISQLQHLFAFYDILDNVTHSLKKMNFIKEGSQPQRQLHHVQPQAI